MLRKGLGCLAAVATASASIAASDCDTLVASVDQLRSVVEDATSQAVRTVCLQPGRYNLSQPLQFAGDSRSITFRSADPRAPAVIDGGAQLTGWSQRTHNGAPAYAAAVPQGVLPDGAVVRNLWVAGQRASRVTLTNPASALGGLTTWSNAAGTTLGFKAGHVPAEWANNTASLEFTWPIVIDNWISPRCTVASIDFGTGNITMTSPCGAHLLHRAAHTTPPPVTIEAVPDLPLQPGTFYHDVAGGVVLYALAADQTPADLESDAWVSALETLVTYTNSSNHVWQDVTFTHAAWNQVNVSPDGYVDTQASVFECSSTATTPSCIGGESEPQGAVAIASSTGIAFINCTFVAMGSPYSLSIDKGSSNCVIAGNTFQDLSGGAIKLGSIDATYANATARTSWDSGSTVTRNVINHTSIEYQGAVAIFGGYLYSATIAHNTIANTGYSGVSVGWGWGTWPPLQGVGNITIAYNRIEDVMTTLRDGGGIYVNGHTNNDAPGSVIANNFVDADEAVFAVYYLDNGASNWHVTENVAANSGAAWAFFMQGCCGAPAANSTVDNFWWSGDLAPVNNCAAEGCVVDAATVVNMTGQAWPAAATAIANAAGAGTGQ